MKVVVKLCGPLRKMVKGHEFGELTLDLDPGTGVSQAVESMGLTDEVRMLMLNGKAALEDRPLVEGDRLTLIPPQLAYNMYVATGFLAPKVRQDIREKQKALEK